jgi:Raf kinase inhibitor-like YbhB/YbcL family protein
VDSWVILPSAMSEHQRPSPAFVTFLAAVFIALGFGLNGSGCASDPASNGGSGGKPGGSGGSSGSGGASASGGATGSGGASASGGATGSGGASASGGATASGGNSGSGGTAGSGGSSSSGGAGGGTAGSAGSSASGGAGGGGGRNGGGAGRNGGGAGRNGGGAGRNGAGGGSAIQMSMTLTSPAFTEGGMFPTANTCSTSSMSGTSPELDWTAGPSGTMSYAMTLTDMTNGFVHWAIWNIPGSTTMLPAMLASTAMLTTPAGASQTNRFSSSGYYGPCPGGTSHSYVFDVYAIPTATLAGMTNTTDAARDSMRAVAIATGTLAGTSNAKRN